MSVFTNEVIGPLTDAELRATPIPVSATFTPSGTQDVNVTQVGGNAVTTTIPVSGTVTADAGTGNFTVVQATGSNLHMVVDSGTVSISGSVAVTGTFWQATQPISAASLPLPTGAATAALQTQPGVDIGDVTVNNAAGAAAVNIQDGGNSITVDGVFFQATQPVSIAGSVAVTGPLTDAELRATPVPVTQGGTGTVTVTRVSVNNTTAVTLSASNSAKQRVVIYNEGGTLFVKFGATASSTDYSYVMTVDSTLEIEGYYGLITARKNSGTTFVQVTEIGI